MQPYNKQLLTTAFTMNATHNFPACQVWEMFGYSIQAVWTGTPTGTFKLQCSSDPATSQFPTAVAPTHWDDISNSSQTISAAGSFTWNVTDAMYNWVRVVYTDASSGMSTASLTSLVFNGKGI